MLPEEPPALQPEAPEQPAPAARSRNPNPELPCQDQISHRCAENIDLLEIERYAQPEQMQLRPYLRKPMPAPAAKAAPEQGTAMYPYINIPHEQPQDLAALVTVQPGPSLSRALAQNPAVSLTLFAFDEGEEISTHSSEGDAMVQVLKVDGVEHTVAAGQVLATAPQLQDAAHRGVPPQGVRNPGNCFTAARGGKERARRPAAR